MAWIWILTTIVLISIAWGWFVYAVEGVFQAFFIFCCLWAVTALGWRAIEWNDYPNQAVSYSAQHVLMAEGLDVTKPIPLTLGSSIIGSQGKISGQGEGVLGFSYFFLEGYSQSASYVRLGIEHKGSSNILEIPFSKVDFIQSKDAKPSALVFLNNDAMVTIWSFTHCKSLMSYGKCWYHGQDYTLESSNEWPNLELMGPAPVIQDHLIKIRLTVTPAQYQAYLKGTALPK